MQGEAARKQDPEQQKRTIRDLFTGIAAHYDRVNRLLSLGQDERWRERALALAEIPPCGALLDVATGTGDMALLARKQSPTARVVGTDLTPAMLSQAQRKSGDHPLPWVVSDGLALAFADGTFDAVTSAFMMRNVPDIGDAFAEQARVVRPGGRVVCLEMTWPRRFPMRWLFGVYFFGLPPLLGGLTAGAWTPYRYLPRSVKNFVEPAVLAEKMTQAGLQAVAWKTMMAGTVAVHMGIKP
ncbi:MAG: ubiquinone/menaquinone biosynthesis methyltransferase [Anaerolineae bacterium]|nr:ubiquinone/menaquinone biosynthesis methyltransferase [Anaerolineae bacterium]